MEGLCEPTGSSPVTPHDPSVSLGLARASYELDRSYCVDLFVRPEGTFGFEHFKRDIDDGGSWTPIGGYAEMRFDSERAALEAARRTVAWLKDCLPPIEDR
ncbi:MAG: hypothetical protein ABR592_07850 [Nitriliruptorales bacterium]